MGMNYQLITIFLSIVLCAVIIFTIIYIKRLRNKQNEMNKELALSNNYLKTLMGNIPDFIYFKDANGKFTKTSRYVELKGIGNEEDVIGKTDFYIFSEEYAKNSIDDDKVIIETGKPIINKIELEILKNGKSSWVSTTKAPIIDKGGNISGIVGISRDITLYKEAQDTVRYQTYHDGLTGLPNRALFNDMLGVAVNQAINTQVSVAVFFIDLDRFKFVNDTIGHAMGDKVLQQASERIASLIEEPNSVARVGGDEFTILLSDMNSIDDAARLGSNIIEILNKPFVMEGHEFFITCSIGISIYPFDGQDGPTLLKNADIAMYRAKEEGRNNYQLYNPSMNVKVFERLALESNLRYALERNEFVVYYQPQVDANKKIVGMEALVRWNHPNMGIISPMSFIPLAEETGLIVSIGEWVLRQACTDNKQLIDEGYEPLKVAVNLSARQFKQHNLVEVVQKILNETHLEPKYLELEITETVAMQDENVTIDVLNEFQKLGIEIAIDDFGTGYSSLSYLKKFPINKMKVDQFFVRNMINNINDASIVNAVINLAHSLDLVVTAEGVETQEHMDFLLKHDCETFQGYLISRPVPIEQFKELLDNE